MKKLLFLGILSVGFALAGCGQNKIDKLIEENNYNEVFIHECIDESFDITNDVFEVITGTLVVDDIYDYHETEDTITTLIQYQYDVNPIGPIHHTVIHSCTKTGDNAVFVSLKSMKTEPYPCPDGTTPPTIGSRCPNTKK